MSTGSDLVQKLGNTLKDYILFILINGWCFPDDVMQQQKSLVSSMEHLSHNVSQLLEHSVQLQNVVVMLQDTHKLVIFLHYLAMHSLSYYETIVGISFASFSLYRSLMSNNHHLLEEITDIKKQHSLEIMQLSANYDSLRSLVHNKLHL